MYILIIHDVFSVEMFCFIIIEIFLILETMPETFGSRRASIVWEGLPGTGSIE